MTLAELYDPDLMPADLREAHAEVDALVDSIYSKRSYDTDEQRLSDLFDMYEAIGLFTDEHLGAAFGAHRGARRFRWVAVARQGRRLDSGAVGSSADNALAESFNATLKREVLQDAACWPDELACRRQVFKWLTRYNTRRRHSWCRYQSPLAYETGYATTLQPGCVITPRVQDPGVRPYRNHHNYQAGILLRSARQTRRRSPLNQQATTSNCG